MQRLEPLLPLVVMQHPMALAVRLSDVTRAASAQPEGKANVMGWSSVFTRHYDDGEISQTRRTFTNEGDAILDAATAYRHARDCNDPATTYVESSDES